MFAGLCYIVEARQHGSIRVIGADRGVNVLGSGIFTLDGSEDFRYRHGSFCVGAWTVKICFC